MDYKSWETYHPGNWGGLWLIRNKTNHRLALRDADGVALSFPDEELAQKQIDKLWGGPWRSSDPCDVYGHLNELGHPERIYLIGAGPSMREAWNLIPQDAYTIGLNRCLTYPRPWNIWLCGDSHAPEDTYWPAGKPKPPGCKYIVVKRIAHLLPEVDYTFEWQPRIDYNYPLYAGLLQSGATIAACGVRLAYELGCRDLVLAGVDMQGAEHYDGSFAAVTRGEWPQKGRLQYCIDFLRARGMRVRTLTPTLLEVDPFVPDKPKRARRKTCAP